MASRLLVFLPQLEADLSSFSDAAEQNLRFLAMLAGPFYPILDLGKERSITKSSGNISDSEVSKSSQASSSLTVSSNFEPRRSRSAAHFVLTTSSSIVFRADAIFMLLRKAYKDSDLGIVCRKASRILHRLIEPVTVHEVLASPDEVTSGDEVTKSEITNPAPLVDYSNLFGEEFKLLDDHWDSSYLNILDIGAVEEGILHVLYACASQPLLCRKLADRTSDFWSALPLIQSLLPALRPLSTRPDIVDDSFSQWRQPIVQQALSQIVATSSSLLYLPLLHSCAGYLSSFSPSHAKAACVLIDLCCSALAPWLTQVIARVDLAVELLEDLLGVIQGAKHYLPRARAAIKYIILAISGHMDDILGKYKEVKHRILFLIEMLEPFLDPAVGRFKGKIAFGDLSSQYPEKQEWNCAVAINVIHTAVQKPAVLFSLESEWRHGSVAPSVLLSIIEPDMQLPPEIDLCISPVSRLPQLEPSTGLSSSATSHHGMVSSKSNSQDESDGKTDETSIKTDILEDASLLFAPPELHDIVLTNKCSSPNEYNSVANLGDVDSEQKYGVGKSFPYQFPSDFKLDSGFSVEFFNLQADYFQLISYQDCELRASEFRRLALDLHSQNEITVESHDAAIDALLLAAECYVNPFFMMSFRGSRKLMNDRNTSRVPLNLGSLEMELVSGKSKSELETIAVLERKRDKVVLQTLLEAAELDKKYQEKISDGNCSPYNTVGCDEEVIKLSPFDVQSADAITLVRQNQALLCSFLVQRLQREQHLMHEILMQCLIFLLNSATKLYCVPEHVIDIALGSAEYLNGTLTSLYNQFKESSVHLEPETVHGIQRRWILLQRLVISASSGDEGMEFAINKNGFSYGNLIPSSAWMQRIATFSRSTSPLVRFLGWMAVSRNARQYIKDRLLLALDLPQLTCLLSIFADELSIVDNVVNRKFEDLGARTVADQDQSFRAIYPDLYKFFPNMKKQFEAFGETILEAVGLQLRFISSSMVPDILCWFSELCTWPFLCTEQISAGNSSNHLKGYASKNAKVIILDLLEAIVTEHMEAMVPEIPRVVQLLASLCRASYCDVSFLDSVLCLLKPIISYSLNKVSNEERLSVDDSCVNFESLCFDELFNNISLIMNQDDSTAKEYNRGLTIFILASVFPDISAQRRKEILKSLMLWADFTAFEPTSSFHNYLCAFQSVMESCKLLLVQSLQFFGAIPLKLPTDELHDCSSESHSWFLSDLWQTSLPDKISENLEGSQGNIMNKKANVLSHEEIAEFSKHLGDLIVKLFSTLELCWNLHHQLAKKITITCTECFMYLKCLASTEESLNVAQENDSEISLPSKPVDEFLVSWSFGLEVISETILTLQENRCWEVASVMLDCVLAVPLKFGLANVIAIICSAIKNCLFSAPKLVWRLQSHKWLSMLLARGIHSFKECEGPLVNLFCTMLGHPEPEQRSIGLQILGKVVGQDLSGAADLQSCLLYRQLVAPDLAISLSESTISSIVSSTWDLVVVLASSDVSLLVKTRAMALLVDYIPYAERRLLQSLLGAADSVHGLGVLAHANSEGPLVRLSLALIAGACLYCPDEDISLIPENVWKNIETLAMSKTDGRLGDVEKRACQVLYRLRAEGDEAKQILREVLSSSSSKQVDPDFESTRESVLQVLASLTSAKAYVDVFSNKIDQEVMEVEEAELELDILQKDVLQESLKETKDKHKIPSLSSPRKDNARLQQIKDHIHSLEMSKLREDIVTRRQKKLLLRHDRQKYLEEAALREAQLLQELDRERAAEVEKDIERQRLIELERAKTMELRQNLEMEKERQAQRDLQRELEQAEAGLRPSRRDFSSTYCSRPRDRYRERENGRGGNEGSTRASNVQLESSSTNSSMGTIPTVVLSGTRTFSGQPPTILQSRDRLDDAGSGYEENLDGSKDSGDTGSVGDPDSLSAFDGQPGGFGSGQRHGSRGSKSRQVVERRERDGRREGKWERKHL
ncbi:uncharacterized protein LOC126801476 isoform X2 [Argentina anserina]|nr:uncharacterized protein LOC126801476 isoform X2 [Potentilla anserina]XP_050384797.1 uncharacterized protein LOC126801476 isoform X2 [Potentilla anserina]